MDWDDIAPKSKKQAVIGEALTTLSIAELVERVTALELEITRVREEISKKQAHEAAAAAFFKS